MYLILEIVSANGAKLGNGRRKVIGPEGGLIGRGRENQWVIEDPHVSRQQARIRCANGVFFLEGLGKNPIAVNDPERFVPNNQPEPLRTGDRFYIDEFEVLACISETATPSASTPAAPRPASRAAALLIPENPFAEPESTPTESIPALLTPGSVAPEQGSSAPPVTEDVRVDPVAAKAAVDVDALLRAAGVSSERISSDTAGELGEVLRIVIEGVMEALRARAEIKSRFRIPLTRVRAHENNPLKFSPNVEAALHALLAEPDRGYMPAPRAFEDAFEDIRSHQLAVLEGMRTAFDSMLAHFEPGRLQADFDNKAGARAGLLNLGAKSRLWDQYTEYFRSLAEDSDDSFRRLFGDEFGQAYERQLQRLKADHRNTHR